MNKKIIALVQARMGSSRLPGKVLKKSCNKTLLSHLIERLSNAKLISKIVVATSNEKIDNQIVSHCIDNDFDYFRGSEKNVLERFTNAAVFFKAEIIVRITADCPLIDHEIVDFAISTFLDYYPKYELVTNRFPLTFPDGLDVDVIDIDSLKKANVEAKDIKYREHIVPYFWERNRPYYNFVDKENKFKDFRWTIDFPKDFIVIDNIISNLYPKFGNKYLTSDILNFLKDNKKISAINSEYIK